MKPWRICCVVSRSQARAVAQFRRGVLAADGSLLERGPFPKAAARYCGAKPAKHHGPALQLRLGAEKQQPGGLKLKNTPDKLTHVWWDPDQESVLYLWGTEKRRWRWITFELSSSFTVVGFTLFMRSWYRPGSLQICVFYCLCVVYLYTNSTVCLRCSCPANCYLVIGLLLDANCFKSSPFTVLWKKYKYIKD